MVHQAPFRVLNRMVTEVTKATHAAAAAAAQRQQS